MFLQSTEIESADGRKMLSTDKCDKTRYIRVLVPSTGTIVRETMIFHEYTIEQNEGANNERIMA